MTYPASATDNRYMLASINESIWTWTTRCLGDTAAGNMTKPSPTTRYAQSGDWMAAVAFLGTTWSRRFPGSSAQAGSQTQS